MSAAPPDFVLRMWIFFAGYFIFGGVTLPFFPVWLQARGLTDIEIAHGLTFIEELRVKLPSGFSAKALPAKVDGKTDFGTATFDAVDKGTEVAVVRGVTLGLNAMPKGRFAQLVRLFEAAEGSRPTGAVPPMPCCVGSGDVGSSGSSRLTRCGSTAWAVRPRRARATDLSGAVG